jgi:hypothetical protein
VAFTKYSRLDCALYRVAGTADARRPSRLKGPSAAGISRFSKSKLRTLGVVASERCERRESERKANRRRDAMVAGAKSDRASNFRE